MAKKFYVVWQGRKPGIYSSWPECQKQTEKFPNPKFKSFSSQQEAEVAFADHWSEYIGGGGNFLKSRESDTQALSPEPNPEVDLQIYCDGACDPNPGQAGSGIAVYRDGSVTELWYGLYNPNGTNNTAELNALLYALQMAEEEIKAKDKPVEVLSDSQYSIDCISKWAKGWEKNGWVRKGGEIKNLDIIKECYAVYTRILPKLVLTHVRGHVGVEGNELADRMSVLAVDKKAETLCQFNGPIDLAAILALRAG